MSLIEFTADDRGVATITLNRPERLNAINLEMRDQLWECLAACSDIPEIQVIVFRGTGRAFSAGADISEFGTAPSVMASRDARLKRDVWSVLLNHRCVTIAVMHGFCFGAGLELPLCCDVRIATTDATFALPEVSLGYIPSAGGTQTLPRLIPPSIAATMIISGEPIDAASAIRWRLVDRVAEPARLEEAVEDAVKSALGGASQDRARRLAMLQSNNASAAASLRA